MFNLLEFQKNAVDNLTNAFLNIWKKDENQIPLVLKAPTGGGKTIIASHFITTLNYLPNWDEDKSFIWITFSDDIAKQSKDKFKLYFENNLENNLLTVLDINKGKLEKNDILFLNWQKIVSKKAETRILRRPETEADRKESGFYFEDLVDNTHNDNRKIILIIDEAHTHVTPLLSQKIIDYINPKIVLHISATPPERIELKSRRLSSFIEVPRNEVIEQGLIKEKIVVQTEEDLQKHQKEDLDEILIDLGLEKRKEIVKEYAKLNKKINPLVLIQLPNDDKALVDLGQKKKEEVVLELLKKKGIEGNKIAKWLDNHPRPDCLEENDDDHEYLLFKQAAGTGWDCPRAHILIMFREINSDTFYIQTVGRILRMPEPNEKEDYKESILLKTGYLYTNYDRNKVNAKWHELSTNKPDYYIAKRKKDISNITLQSSYVSRIDYGDLSDSAKFQMSFIKSMDNYFGLTQKNISTSASKILASRGVELDIKLTNKIIVDAKYDDFDTLSYDFFKKGHDITLDMSRNDVEKTFNYICYSLLKEQTEERAKISNIARSWSPLKSAIRVWFKKIFGNNSDYYYRLFIYDINKEASSIFRPAITNAIKEYRPILQKIIEEKRKKQEKKEAPTFAIQEEYSYTEDYKEVDTNLCALDKSYFRKDYTGKLNEARFRKYIDIKKDTIDWWFKNGDYGKNNYAIKYWHSNENNYQLFYPDWIIRFKDGRIGIFDTKAGSTALTDRVKDKAKALSMKLKELGENYIGGIVVFENGIWYYNTSENYIYSPGQLNPEWKPLESLF